MALAQCDSASTQLLFQSSNSGWKVRISAMEYASVFELATTTAYQQIQEAGEQLFNRYIRYTSAGKRGKTIEHKIRWVSSAKYADGEGWIELNFTPEVGPHLLGLKSHFTTYTLAHARSFDSVYAWRLYELLKSWSSSGQYSPDIEAFQDSMEVPESCRKNFKDLRTRVIEPAVRAINAQSDVVVQWEPLRQGARKVTGLEFRFVPKAQTPLDLRPAEDNSLQIS